MNTFYDKNEIKISKTALIIIFIGLIRTLADGVYKLSEGISLTLPQLSLYLVGSLFTSSALLFMVVLFFFRKYTWVSMVALITLIGMIWIKSAYT